MDAQLNRLLDDAYDVFAPYARPTVLDASPLRDPEKLLKQLTAKPLRLLDVVNVQEYAAAALTTVGTVEDFKHFLPRLIDLAVQSGVIEPEMIALKLKKADWREWSRNEQKIIEEVIVCACLHAFTRHPDEYRADGWLVSLAILNVGLDRLLAKFPTSNNDCSALQLANLLLSETVFARDPSESGYWEEVTTKTLQETRSWLLSEETRMRLLTTKSRIDSRDIYLLEKAIARQDSHIQQRLH